MPESRIYVYVVDRDFGFAPNPFHGYCSLATCKPGIRKQAKEGDWIFGVGGSRLDAAGRCIFAMRVSNAVTFDEYWSNPAYRAKKPIRNGSRKMLVGDNIYHYNDTKGKWLQADSHHSNPDGTANTHNVANDTQTNRVLISDHFYYFGSSAPEMPVKILEKMNYKNGRNYRVFTHSSGESLVSWLEVTFAKDLNSVLADPFDFDASEKRYSVNGNKVL